MEKNQVTVNRISWRDICPWLTIFRALPHAASLTILLLALLGAVISPVGWVVMQGICLSEEMLADDPALASIAAVNRSPYRVAFPTSSSGSAAATIVSNPIQGVALFYSSLTGSIGQLFSHQPGIWRFAYFLGGSVWSIVVWSFFGCAISRAALMRLTRDEPIGLRESVEYAVEKFLSCIAGIAIPLIAVFGLTLPLALIGLLMSNSFGAMIGGFFWFGVLAISFLIAVILFGLMFSWPLIICAISCEGQDSFDGLSRAFAYVFQRPLHYLVYVTVAIVFSGLCWFVVSSLVEGTIQTASWATSWGMLKSSNRTADMVPGIGGLPVSCRAAVRPVNMPRVALARGGGMDLLALVDIVTQREAQAVAAKPAATPGLGQRLAGFWEAVARTCGAAFLFGLFWSLAAAIYLLLRKDLDNTEMDEIFLVDQNRTYELPPLKETAAGVPAVERDSQGPTSVEPDPTEGDRPIDS